MSDFGWGLVLLGAYIVLVILARWLYIARTNVVWTNAHAEAMVKRLAFQVERDPSGAGKATLMQLLDEIKDEPPHGRFSSVIGWSGADQIAKWVLMHEAERLALATLSHPELVARLERALGQIDELSQPRREAWEDVIRTLLAAGGEADTEQLNRVYRAYLDELLGEIYEASEGKATQLSGLYNRATWILLIAILPVAALVGLGYGVLLVAGAIGGLVSRMQRLVFSPRVPVTYGSSWAQLFFAPILGALAAWAGLNFLSLLQTLDILVLPSLGTSIADLRSPSPALIGAAILLGVAERFLLRLDRQAETIIDPGSYYRAARIATGDTTTQGAARKVRLLRPPSGLRPPLSQVVDLTSMVNYRGYVYAQLVPADGDELVRARLRVWFATQEDSGIPKESAMHAPVVIQGGEDGEQVQFVVTVVGSSTLTPFPTRQVVTAPTDGESQRYEFTLAHEADGNANGGAQAGDDDTERIQHLTPVLIEVTQNDRTLQILEVAPTSDET
jgi:hypothetical protein